LHQSVDQVLNNQSQIFMHTKYAAGNSVCTTACYL